MFGVSVQRTKSREGTNFAPRLDVRSPKHSASGAFPLIPNDCELWVLEIRYRLAHAPRSPHLKTHEILFYYWQLDCLAASNKMGFLAQTVA